MTIPQIGAMYGGDRSRKENLIANGFRLPSAFDNRPLRFDEFEQKLKQVVAVSATPKEYEIEKSCLLLHEKTSEETQKRAKKFTDFHPQDGVIWKDEENMRVVPQMIRPT